MNMKRKIFIIMLATAATFNLNGCSKVEIEKHPVKVEDSNANLDTTLLDEKNNENEKQNTELADKTLNENSATNNIADTTAKETSPESKPKDTTVNSELEGKEVDLNIEIEGSTEIVKGKIHASELGYQMVYDSENFELTTDSEIDSYMAKNPNPAVYPYVFLNVSRHENTTRDDYAKELEKDINSKMASSKNIENKSIKPTIQEPLFMSYKKSEYKYIGEQENETIYFRMQSGYKSNSIIREYYVIQDDSDIILIETQCFLEAEEGYGARFLAMIDTFKIQ
jgi:hypothetical protein